jgi:hypothetical protein
MGLDNITQGFINELKTILIGVIVLQALMFVIMTYRRTQSPVACLGAIVVGALILWGVSNYVTLKDSVDTTITNMDRSPNPSLAEQGP